MTETTNDKLEVDAGCLGICFVIWLGPLMILTGMCCLIASVSTAHWLEHTQGDLDIHGGLFEVCFVRPNSSFCRSWDDSVLVDDTDNVKLCIAALILSCIGYLIGFFVMSCFVFSVLDRSGPSWGGTSSWLSAWAFNATGLGMFVKFQNAPRDITFTSYLGDFDYGYSFHLCWICLILVMVGCGASVLVALCWAGGDTVVEGEEGAAQEGTAEPGTNRIREDVYGPNAQAAQPVSFVSMTETVKSS